MNSEDRMIASRTVFSSLPNDIKNKAIDFLRKELLEEEIIDIRKAIKEKPNDWWALSHFSWGMSIRNKLRQNVALDDKLPTKNWDDYYVQLVEEAVKLKD